MERETARKEEKEGDLLLAPILPPLLLPSRFLALSLLPWARVREAPVARVDGRDVLSLVMRISRFTLVLAGSIVIAGGSAACGANSGSKFDGGNGGSGSSFVTGSSGIAAGTSGSASLSQNNGDASQPGDEAGSLAITTSASAIDVTYGQQSPTVTAIASINGVQVPASFTVDRGELGSIDAATGVFTPTGAVGGVVTIVATFSGQVATASVSITVHWVQSGADADAGTGGAADAGGGLGGNGGVGGEGPGAAPDPATITALGTTPVADPSLQFLYPYDQTVWPRGLLAPLLQWSTTQSYDAVSIHIQESAFEYQGYFASTATPFVHHPVPQAAWDALAYSNGGEAVKVTLVFAAGGVAYGPLTQTWTFAPTSLTGTVYYNSYGTNLAHNYCCTLGGAEFGGATLAIRHGATSPVLVAGSDSECRVCHSVSADGSRLVTGQGESANYFGSSAYDLGTLAETSLSPEDGRFNWAALYPDGTFLLANNAPIAGAGFTQPTQLIAVGDGGIVPSTGLPPTLQVGSPVFSPDGKHVAFNFYGGAGSDGGAADGTSLAMMDYDAATSTFSNFQILYTPPLGTSVWPSFLPTGAAVIFELETVSDGSYWGETRKCPGSATCSNPGTQAQLWWVDVATKRAAPLASLNGATYLPTAPGTGHPDDTVLNYDPTVNPVAGGGYAWVVFTSRRLYGNIATIDPYESDPRYFDLTSSPTTKKLWVAAIDLNAAPGTDPSHPAFYLPAQELLAGNSRGYWVVDACEANGTTCLTGDQCCGGYCSEVDGGLVCSDQPPSCSTEFDKCTQTSQCCGAAQGMQCIGGRCATVSPPVPR